MLKQPTTQAEAIKLKQGKGVKGAKYQPIPTVKGDKANAVKVNR